MVYHPGAAPRGLGLDVRSQPLGHDTCQLGRREKDRDGKTGCAGEACFSENQARAASKASVGRCGQMAPGEPKSMGYSIGGQ